MNPRRFFLGRAIGMLVLLAIVGIAAGFYWFNGYIYEQKQAPVGESAKNAEYMIEGERVRLVDGAAEEDVAPGSASKIITRYFGQEVYDDLDDDGRQDVVFLLTQETGGSGTFFYAVAALNTGRGYVGSEAIFIGDRIAPQSAHLSENPRHKHVIIINWAERAPGEPMTAAPSAGKSIWIKLDPVSMQFGEVAQNFEGESNQL